MGIFDRFSRQKDDPTASTQATTQSTPALVRAQATANRLKNFIGYGKNKVAHPQVQAPAQPVQMAQQATITIQQNPVLPKTTTSMSREELKARRMARVENASGLVEHFHVRLMLKYLDFLLIVVPFGIIALTTSELGQLFTGKPFNIADQTSVNMYAAALLAECVYCGTTFIWQYSNAYKMSLDNAQEMAQMERFTRGVAATWWLFSAISALGQYTYLSSIWHPSVSTAGILAYALIFARVTMFLGSDYACAKYLGWRVTTLRKVAQEEKAKGEMYLELEANEAIRIQKEAEADAHLRQIEMQVATAERNARMATEVSEIMSKSAVKFLGQFTNTLDNVMNNVLNNVNQQLQGPIDGEVKQLPESPESKEEDI